MKIDDTTQSDNEKLQDSNDESGDQAKDGSAAPSVGISVRRPGAGGDEGSGGSGGSGASQG